MHFLQEPIFWVIATALSEIIGMSKLKSNSVVELAIRAIFSLQPKDTKNPERND